MVRLKVPYVLGASLRLMVGGMLGLMIGLALGANDGEIEGAIVLGASLGLTDDAGWHDWTRTWI